MAVEAELGLDAEDDEAAVHQLLGLRRPGIVQIRALVLGDLGVVDVQVHQNRGLNARFRSLRIAKGLLDNLLTRLHYCLLGNYPKTQKNYTHI